MSSQTPSKTTSRKVYRFALYGVSAAGKTCLLAALGMNRKPNPSGYDAVRLPCNLTNTEGDPQNGTAVDDAASARRGEKWLDDAMCELRNGRVPLANPISADLMTYWFDISAPDRTWHVELFDYSGELVDARKAVDPVTLAAKLHEHLKVMDGLFVLLAAPHPDKPLERNHQELQLLKEAFTALRAEASEGPVLTKPVVLLVNKWDRQSDNLSGNSESERPGLEAFLKEDRHAAWQGVAQAIENGVVPECFDMFPVSAFGKGERVSNNGQTIERPMYPAELPSFGLEDPFVWAARKIDELDLSHYEVQTNALNEVGWPWEAGRLARIGTPLVRRFAPRTEERERAEKARSRCRKVTLVRWGLTVLSVLLLLLGGEFLFDVKANREAMAAISDEKAAEKDTIKAEAWLSEYSNSLGIRHLGLASFVLSREKAGEIVRAYHEQQESKLWSQVEAAKSEVEHYEAAVRYLERFPKGRHANEAEGLIAENKRRIRVQENNNWLARQEAAVGPILASNQIEKLKVTLAELEEPPHPADTDDDFNSRCAVLRNDLSKRLTERILDEDWKIFLATYRESMGQRRLDQAGRMLHQRQPVEQNLQILRQQFAKALPGELKLAIDDLIQRRYWDDARTLLTNLDHDHVLWPADMRSEGDAQLFHDQQQRVADAHDRSLYEHFCKFRTDDTAKIYLDLHPPGRMQSDVKKYLDHLHAKKQKHQFTVVLEAIEWPEEYPDDDDNVIRFDVEGNLVSEVEEVDSNPNGNTGEIGSYEIEEERLLTSSVELTVKIVNVESLLGLDGIRRDINGGEGTETVKFSELDGYRQTLKAGKDGKWGQCIAQYRLLGGESGRIEPKLHDWSRQ